MSIDLPFSQACENNKQPILECLQQVFVDPGLILEIGTGTGQHALHLASHLPHLRWQPTDHPENVGQSAKRIELAKLKNILPSRALDVSKEPWPVEHINGAYQWSILSQYRAHYELVAS